MNTFIVYAVGMALLQLTLASAAYAFGGVFMKLSDGVTRARPTAVFVLLFVAGALTQARGMRHEHVGASYVYVLGVEAVIAVLLSAVYLRESYAPSRLAAIVVVIAGVAWLRNT